MTDIETPNVNTFLENMNLKKLIKLAAGLSTIVILTADIGVELTDLEKKIYSNKLFLFLAVFSIGYVDSENTNNAIFLFLVWFTIKYVLPQIMKKRKENEDK